MTIQKTNWLSKHLTNLLVTITGIIITAFFMDFQEFKKEMRQDNKELGKRVTDVEIASAVNNYTINELQKKVNDLCTAYTELHLKVDTRSGGKSTSQVLTEKK